MLCTAVSCTAKYNSGKGDALLELTDGPTDIGDRVSYVGGRSLYGYIEISNDGFVLCQQLVILLEDCVLCKHYHTEN